MTSRAARRAVLRDAQAQAADGKAAPPVKRRERDGTQNASSLRMLVFGLLSVAILGAGVYLAGSVFLGSRGSASAGQISMRVSMDGFTPPVLEATPGQALSIDWWNTDGAMHLTNGVHTLVSDTLQVRLELPAQAHKAIVLTAPTTPGDYDFWCDSCCGGKDNPKMHGTLRVKE
jgi:cytochrome c oxidase subunit 2